VAKLHGHVDVSLGAVLLDRGKDAGPLAVLEHGLGRAAVGSVVLGEAGRQQCPVSEAVAPAAAASRLRRRRGVAAEDEDGFLAGIGGLGGCRDCGQR